MQTVMILCRSHGGQCEGSVCQGRVTGGVGGCYANSNDPVQMTQWSV